MTSARHHIPASIELSPKQVLDKEGAYDGIPKGTSVYLVDVGTETDDRFASAATRLKSAGLNPVPHFAARRLQSMSAFESRLKAMAQSAHITQVLAIGGGSDRPNGPFSSTMEMLNTGLFEHYGIKKIGVAGHPEGSPDFSDEIAVAALLEKQAYASRNGLDLYIVTQFGFDAKSFITWAENLPSQGVHLPVHIGVSGPAKMTSLMKYAVISGVGNSLRFLKRNALSVKALASGFDPESVVKPIEDHWKQNPDSPIEHIQVFAFGGSAATSQWLRDRGSWT